MLYYRMAQICMEKIYDPMTVKVGACSAYAATLAMSVNASLKQGV